MKNGKKRGMSREKRNVILICVGVCMAVAIIVLAILLMGRSKGEDKYGEYYAAAMEYYIAGDYGSAVSQAQRAYDEDATEDAAVLLARCYYQRGDSTSAIYLLESWLSKNSGSAAEALLAEYKGAEDEEETATVGGKEVTPETETLVISGVGLSSAELDTVAGLTELTALSLNDCGLRDLSFLKGLTKLRSLSLTDNSIEDITALSGLTELRTLYLSGNPIESLEPLYSLVSLTTLDIRGREITDTELAQLKEKLQNCTVFSDEATVEVKDLSLGGVSFKSDVTELDLSGRGITDISVLADCTALKSLSLSGNTELSDISALVNMPELTRLDLGSTKVSSLSPIISLTKLQYLDLSKSAVTNLAAISGLTELTELKLDGCSISSLSALSGLTKLTSLSLRDMSITDSALASLEGLSALKTLDLTGCLALTGEAVDNLKAKLPSSCQVSTSEEIYGVRLGESVYNVKDSFVDASGQNVQSLTEISRFKSLQTLLLNNNPNLSLSGLGTQTSLTALELNSCGLTSVDELRTLTALRSLSLMYNDLREIEALGAMKELRELHLSYNSRLADLSPLSSCTNLEYLSLNGCGVWELSALKDLKNLQTLDLENCTITDTSALYSMTGLRTLYLRGCGISQMEINYLASCLPDCAIYS